MKNQQMLSKKEQASAFVLGIAAGMVVLLVLGFILYQIPFVKSRAAWRINFAATYVKGLVDPVQAVPTAASDGVIEWITFSESTMRYGSTGLLAHNYLSGKRFFDLAIGQDVVIIHGDGHRDLFRINQIQEYQALTPNSPYSRFIDLDDPTQTVITSTELFKRGFTPRLIRSSFRRVLKLSAISPGDGSS